MAQRKKEFYDLFRETHSVPADEYLWKEEWGGSVLFSHGLKNARGVMILFNKHFDIKIVNLELHPQGRWIILWRLKNPKLKRYTWRRQNQASRIDYFLT